MELKIESVINEFREREFIESAGRIDWLKGNVVGEQTLCVCVGNYGKQNQENTHRTKLDNRNFLFQKKSKSNDFFPL